MMKLILKSTTKGTELRKDNLFWTLNQISFEIYEHDLK